MARKIKTLLVAAQNAGTINGKKTTTLPADIDAAVNGLNVDVELVSVASPGVNFPDQVLVTVLYEGTIEKETVDQKKKK